MTHLNGLIQNCGKDWKVNDMTYEDVFEALERTGMPVTYEAWASPDDIPSLPYIVFTYPESDDLYADNINYGHIMQLDVRLYTKRKSIADERTVENVINTYIGAYLKQSEYVSADAMQETTYLCEVAINGE